MFKVWAVGDVLMPQDGWVVPQRHGGGGTSLLPDAGLGCGGRFTSSVGINIYIS